MPDLVSEVDSDRRAARASRAWPLPGSGARARASGFGGRTQPAARRIMSHTLDAATCRPTDPRSSREGQLLAGSKVTPGITAPDIRANGLEC